MRLHRFYISENVGSIGPTDISMADENLIHQLLNVFRYRSGQQVIFFNNTGFDYVYEITEINKTGVNFVLLNKIVNKTFDNRITLAFSIVKKDNSELIIQKCTELGVAKFQPLISDRTEKKGFDSVRAKKIAIEAVEQSGRDIIPEIFEPVEFNDFVNEYCNDKNFNNSYKNSILAFDISGEKFDVEKVLKNFSDNDQKSIRGNLTILMGPEGGWSESEITIFRENNISIYKFGDFVLRAETAAIFASSVIVNFLSK